MSHINNQKCSKKLHIDSLEDLGKKVVLSAVLFETSVAAVLNTESEKLQVLIENFKKNQCDKVELKDLLSVNEDLKGIACCLKGLEESIVEKIEIGWKLIEKDKAMPCDIEEDSCSCSCSCSCNESESESESESD